MKDYIKIYKDAERRFMSVEPIEIEERTEGENKRSITGYAAVFNKDSEDFGGWIERIAPGAFDDVVNDPAAILFNHDPNLVLARNGITATITQDSKGLKYRFDAPNTTLGNDLLELIRTKTIQGSSFAFTIKEQKWMEPDNKKEPAIRTITKVERLYDVSPVTYPAYPDTMVALRSKPNFVDENKAKEELREIAMKQIQYELLKLKNSI